MKVLIVGLPKFAHKLANDLQSFDSNNKYLSFNTYYSFIDKLLFVYHLFKSDIVYSIHGAIIGSKALDFALRLNKKLIMHWVGTDVIDAQKNYKQGNINPKYIHSIKHFCEVNWIKKELSVIDIHAKEINFFCYGKNISTEINFPDNFSILTYIGKNREVFYGIDEIVALAKTIPDIPVNIVGIEAYHKPLPPNIKLLGWVEDMDSLFESSVVCVRFPYHDGLSSFVLEALAKGRHVIYKYDYPNCYKAVDVDSLIHQAKVLKKKFDDKKLSINSKGIAFIQKEFNQKYILGKLIAEFKKIISESA